MQAPPPQQPPQRRSQVFAPVQTLAKIKYHTEGLVLHLGENLKLRDRYVRDLHSECMALAEVARQALEDPRMTPLQKEQASRDVEALKATLALALQVLAINKQYMEDAIQTEFMLQSVAQRWVAGLPPDFSILGPITPPQQEEASSEPEREPTPESIKASLSSSLANPNWPEAPEAPRSVAPHRVMPMPKAPAIAPRAPQPQPQAQPEPPESGKLSAVSED
jgi:hypothetical protein